MPLPKPPTQLQMFDGLKEPPAAKASWLLETELRGPGALDADAFAVYRIVCAAPNGIGEVDLLSRLCQRDHDWARRRAERAISRVHLAGFIERDGCVLREREAVRPPRSAG